MGHFTQKSGLPASLGHPGVLAKWGHYRWGTETQLCLSNRATQAPPVFLNPAGVPVTTHIICLGRTSLPSSRGQAGAEGLSVPPLSEPCLPLSSPLARVTRPCPGGGFTATGVIASAQARHDGAGRARTCLHTSLGLEPGAEGGGHPSQGHPSPCGEGASSTAAGFLFVSQV